VAGNLRLIVPIARKFGRRIQGSSLGMEDLLQAGTYGLIRAVELFDPERGYSLTTPSYWSISQAIRRAVQDSAQPIRAPIHAQDLLRRWRYRPEGLISSKTLSRHHSGPSPESQGNAHPGHLT
jgi:RNA polymerase sigma factor (sigma-70 family)